MTLPDGFLARPIAHRALHGPGVAENSATAVRAAIDCGWGIEVDVQPAADGTPMVFHDYALDRLCGVEGWVRLTPVEDLRRMSLLGSGAGVPTLSDVLEIVGGRVPLVIEVKDQDGALGPGIGALEQAVADVIRGYSGPLALMSFNPNSVRVLGGMAPDVPRGLVTDAFTREDWAMVPAPRRDKLARMADLDACGASFISHNRRTLDTAPVREVKRRGLPVLTWTVRSAAEEAEARRVADQITFEGYVPAI